MHFAYHRTSISASSDGLRNSLGYNNKSSPSKGSRSDDFDFVSPPPSPSPAVHHALAELKARQEELHERLTQSWEENTQLYHESLERHRPTGVGHHLLLFFDHSARAVGKLLADTPCYRGAAYALDLCASYIATKKESSGPQGATIGSREAKSAADALQPNLTRRSRASGTKTKSDAEKRALKMYVPEDKWEQAETDVYFPKQPWKQQWDIVILVLILYSCVIVPFRIGMDADAEGYTRLAKHIKAAPTHHSLSHHHHHLLTPPPCLLLTGICGRLRSGSPSCSSPTSSSTLIPRTWRVQTIA